MSDKKENNNIMNNDSVEHTPDNQERGNEASELNADSFAKKGKKNKILSSEFLEEIKAKRLEKNITIEEIAAHTNIKERFIIAIEEGDLSSLPGGVYNKAYIRTISEFLGVSTAPYEKFVEDASKIETEVIKFRFQTSKKDASPSFLLVLSLLAVMIVIYVLFFAGFNAKTPYDTNETSGQATETIQKSAIYEQYFVVSFYAKKEDAKISYEQDDASFKTYNFKKDEVKIFYLSDNFDKKFKSTNYSDFDIFVDGMRLKNIEEILLSNPDKNFVDLKLIKEAIGQIKTSTDLTNPPL